MLTTLAVSLCICLAQPEVSVSDLFSKSLDAGTELDLIQVLQAIRKPKVLVLDIRSRREYILGRVPGALNIPADEVEQWATQSQTRATNFANVLVYGAGDTGEIYAAGRALVAHGWKGRVYLFSRGLDLWTVCGLPLESTAPIITQTSDKTTL